MKQWYVLYVFLYSYTLSFEIVLGTFVDIRSTNVISFGGLALMLGTKEIWNDQNDLGMISQGNAAWNTTIKAYCIRCYTRERWEFKSLNCFELWNVFGTIFGKCAFPKTRTGWCEHAKSNVKLKIWPPFSWGWMTTTCIWIVLRNNINHKKISYEHSFKIS